MLNRIVSIIGALLVFCSLTFAGEPELIPVDPVMIAPFIVLLAAIALGPFVNKEWWEHNYPAVAVSLGLLTVGYYIFIIHNTPRVLTTAHEYFSFIVLIGSLYVVSGGIYFQLRGKSTPMNNVILLGIGAVTANIVGTTGASMLLIRPYIKVNRYRIKPFHIVFFIFLVSNIGGAITPIGDPPLFLGYLKGIPFFWIAQHVWWEWLFVVVLLLLIFFIIDERDYKKQSERVQERVEKEGEEARIGGIGNVGFLMTILIAVFIENPMFLREILMITAAVLSYKTTQKSVHEKNEFNFHPIKEVAILFIGIFATMMPALDWLTLNAAKLGLTSTSHYFWATGTLSAVLDNAPTYLNFLTAAMGLHGFSIDNSAHMHEFLAQHWDYVQAVSLAAVFFGACTYIGNGPNFMVKSIAEQSGIEMPSFMQYIIRYTLVFLVPIYFIFWLVFF